MRQSIKTRRQAGFSLIELMIVVAVLTILLGGVFRLLRNMQVRNTSEQDRLEVVQPGREVLDQIVRELGQAGAPSARMFIDFDPTSSTASQIPNNAAITSYVAVGITQITPTSITFEGDVDGSGQVSTVTYQVITSGGACPCLQRLQAPKLGGVGATPAITTVLSNLDLNGVTPFVGIRGDDNTLVTAATYGGDAQAIANIKKVQITLPLRSSIPDTDTKRAPTATMQTTVNIRNCSTAYMVSVSAGTAVNACF